MTPRQYSIHSLRRLPKLYIHQNIKDCMLDELFIDFEDLPVRSSVYVYDSDLKYMPLLWNVSTRVFDWFNFQNAKFLSQIRTTDGTIYVRFYPNKWEILVPNY
jgi:hypothetical protein